MLSQKEIHDFIRSLVIFKELNDGEIQLLSPLVEEKTYQKGDIVFLEDEKKQRIFFIHSGQIKVYKIDINGREQIINLLQDGAMFPHLGFFEDTPYPATTECLKESNILSLHVSDFEHILIQYPNVSIKLMRVMSRMLQDLQQRIQQLTSGDASERVRYILIQLANDYGTETERGIQIKSHMTNQDLANMIGTSRETVSRVLGQFRKKGFITYTNDGLILRPGFFE